jgi:hypothetical protein
MAEWLAMRPDGRTVKAAYAEAARLASELSTNTSMAVLPGSAGVPPAVRTTEPGRAGGPEARAPRERERRPVLVLTRELRECLERVAASVERDEPLPAGARETLTAVEVLMSGNR